MVLFSHVSVNIIMSGLQPSIRFSHALFLPDTDCQFTCIILSGLPGPCTLRLGEDVCLGWALLSSDEMLAFVDSKEAVDRLSDEGWLVGDSSHSRLEQSQ